MTTESTDLALLDLGQLEQVIERGMATFREVGNALVEIRDGKKYRAAGYKTFEVYCLERWNLSRTHAYEVMAAAETAALLSANADIPTPRSEGQIRHLASLPDEDKPKAWSEAVDAAGGAQPSGAQVAAAASKYRPPREKVVEKAYEALVEAGVETDGHDFDLRDEAEAIADEVETWVAENDDAWDNADFHIFEVVQDVAEAVDEAGDQGRQATTSFVDEVIAGCTESKRIPQRQSKPDLGGGVSHPARYSEELFPHFAELLVGYDRVLDPFAGTGKIHQLQDDGHQTVGVELEPEWANVHLDTIVGNALRLPFDDDTFDAICTSPTYGNRLADHHNAYDPEARHSYTHDLGRQLHDDNSGAMQWGPEYRDFHEKAWVEAVRVLRPFGRFVLNLKDHIRAGAWQDVLGWHVATLGRLDLEVVAIRPVVTRSLRTGATADQRVDAEMIVAFEKAAR